MCGEKGLEVSSGVAIFHVGKELELSLHASRGEDCKGFAGLFPGFKCWDHVVEERGLEIARAIPGLPELAYLWSVASKESCRRYAIVV
jgi:hypothetical protein